MKIRWNFKEDFEKNLRETEEKFSKKKRKSFLSKYRGSEEIIYVLLKIFSVKT